MEKIIRIEPLIFKDDNDYYTSEGYQIITDKQTIKIGIENQQSCCEEWGYFMSEDNLNDYIGADLLNVKVVDKCLNVKAFEEKCVEQGDALFVNFETSKGTLQFTAYNIHNGYYGHDAIIISEQLNQTFRL